MKKLNVIRHLAFEDLGSFTDIFTGLGFEISYYEAGVDDLGAAPLAEPDLLVVLGGPISVNDKHCFPFLQQEVDLLRKRIEADLPTLGICLGAQLIALAAGARVYPGEHKEIGWFDLSVSQHGEQTALRHLDGRYCCMLHWHGETFSLPASARLLASSAACENQAFSLGGRILALQFHPEVTRSGLERWYIGHIAEIEACGLDVNQLRAQTADNAGRLQQQGALFIREWLQHAGLVDA